MPSPRRKLVIGMAVVHSLRQAVPATCARESPSVGRVAEEHRLDTVPSERESLSFSQRLAGPLIDDLPGRWQLDIDGEPPRVQPPHAAAARGVAFMERFLRMNT